MKNRILIFSMAALMAACNSNPKATTTESKAKEAPERQQLPLLQPLQKSRSQHSIHCQYR
jgi:starvation-inducible outer membrane lipoprotein